MRSSFPVPLLILGAAGTFIATGKMITLRLYYLASQRKVLIAGGSVPGAELYDLVTGAFKAIGSITTIWPSGGVLLPDGRVLFAEGDLLTGKAVNLEFHDPSTGTFKVAGSLATLTAVNSATLLNEVE